MKENKTMNVSSYKIKQTRQKMLTAVKHPKWREIVRGMGDDEIVECIIDPELIKDQIVGFNAMKSFL